MSIEINVQKGEYPEVDVQGVGAQRSGSLEKRAFGELVVHHKSFHPE